MKSMKYIKLISVCLFFVMAPQIKACWGPTYSPAEYLMFNPVLKEDDDNVYENCLLWQQQTSKDIPIEDIKQAVYKLSYEDIEQALTNNSDNKFLQWIYQKQDKEVVDFLVLAKHCEELRGIMADVWYYPAKNDSTINSLHKVVEIARSYKGSRFVGRYALQVVRALYTMGNYKDCSDYWELMESQLSDDVLKRMTKSYVAGAELKQGRTDMARKMYLEINDWRSVVCSIDVNYSYENRLSQLKIVCDLAPNCREAQRQAFEIIRANEIEIDDIGKLLEMNKLCLKMAKSEEVKEHSFWWYAASMCSILLNDDSMALRYVNRAIACSSDKENTERFKVLKIFLEAKLRPLGNDYDSWLMKQIAWYEQKIRKDKYVMERVDAMNYNLSDYYWNDMLRRVLLGAVCPKMVKGDQPVKALHVANVGDNMILKISEENDSNMSRKNIIGCDEEICNYWDFRNALFFLMDTIGVDNVVKYKQRLDCPRTAFDHFMAQRSYHDNDYFNEIIGTQMLRNMRYEEAVDYFSKVSFEYEKQLNTRCYLNREPFKWESYKIVEQSDAKYNFARKMRNLERDIKSSREPNRKAEMMMEFSLGLRNSFTNVWALTQYYKGESINGHGGSIYEWSESRLYCNALHRADYMESESFKMFTDSEAAAKANAIFGRYWEIADNYSDTNTAKRLLISCDRYKDYFPRRKNKK